MQQKIQKNSLKTGSPIESHAARVLTPYAFNILQEELVFAPQYASLMLDENYFIVRHHTQLDGGHKVFWSPTDEFISCSCQHFEFCGILCRHVLRVLSTNNCFHIPNQYLPPRWCNDPLTLSCIPSEKNSKAELLQSMVSTLVTESAETEERLDTACSQVALLLSRINGLAGAAMLDGIKSNLPYQVPSPSVQDSAENIVQSYTTSAPTLTSCNLGKQKERRSRDSSIDTYKKLRRSCCSAPCWGQMEHDASECDIMSDDDVIGRFL